MSPKARPKRIIKSRGRAQRASKRIASVRYRVIRQKKAFLAIAGIGASGFADISADHNKYLYKSSYDYQNETWP